MTANLASLLAIDGDLARAGELPLTRFWRGVAEQLYSHPTANQLVARVGRGGIKSTFGSKVALNEVLHGDFEVPGSECHHWIDTSENKAEAHQRLRQYETWLTILGIPFDRKEDRIELRGERRGFYVRAFQIGKVSGFRGLGYRCDELAKLDNSEDCADQASEVVASLNAVCVTHLKHRAKGLLLSSPFSTVDYHAERFALGDTDTQITAFAPTWVANPAVTEADTYRIEQDEDRRLREYAAIPSATEGTAFVAEHVRACFEEHHGLFSWANNIMLLDPADSQNDFAGMVGSWGEPSQERRLREIPIVMHDAQGNPMYGVTRREGDYEPVAERPLFLVRHAFRWTGEELRVTPMEVIARQIVHIAQQYGVDCNRCFSDEYQAKSLAGLVSVLSEGCLRMRWFKTTNQEKHESVELVRQWMRDKQICILSHPHQTQMMKDMLEYPRRASGGNFIYGARRTGRRHWDFASLFVLLGRVALEDRAAEQGDSSHTLDGSPVRRGGGRRYEVSGGL
jgi:hypothetical protein